jgi:NAD-dependent deacetylase sirtuin 1
LRPARARAAAPPPSAAEAQEIFDGDVFAREPELFWAAAPRLYAALAAARPTRAHAWLAALDARGCLARVYSQNVDGLEAAAGVAATRLVSCHGSLASATCTRCGRRARAPALLAAAAAARGGVVTCRSAGGRCALAPMRPDIVFYRQPLPAAFGDAVAADAAAAVDAVVVLGTRCAVEPVSTLPARMPAAALRVLVNRERLAAPLLPPAAKRRRAAAPAAVPPRFDVEILGEADVACQFLLRELETDGAALREATRAVAEDCAHLHLHQTCLTVSRDSGAAALLCTVVQAAACTVGGGARTSRTG